MPRAAKQTAEPTWIRVTETVLSDGSSVYGILIGDVELACTDIDAAYRAANALDDATLDTQFDGWGTIKRRA
jgi:hypothetical protein